MPFTATPLTAVDEVIRPAAAEVVAIKRITADDPYLAGHFPGMPVYPGVFVVETVRQAMEAILPDLTGKPGTADLVTITALRLFKPLTPGDTLTAKVSSTPGPSGRYVASGQCTRDDGTLVAQVAIEVRSTGGAATVAEPAIGHRLLLGMLRHRHPMLLVDRVDTVTVTGTGPGSTLVSTKAVTAAELCFAGLGMNDEFAYPPVLLLESFLQSAALLWARAMPAPGDVTMVLGGARRVEFPSAAHPGDLVRHRVCLDSVIGGTAFVSGTSVVAGNPDRPVLAVTGGIVARRVLEPAGAGQR